MSQFETWIKNKEDKIKEKSELILKNANINSDLDIPFLSGYSISGETIYFDRHLPKYVYLKDRKIDLYKYLKVHESVEKATMMLYNFGYESSHRIALHFERKAVEEDDIPWKFYDKITDKYIKTVEGEKITKLPKDLDLTPYESFHDEKSEKLLQHMKELMK